MSDIVLLILTDENYTSYCNSYVQEYLKCFKTSLTP